jgi:hypothetical protein
MIFPFYAHNTQGHKNCVFTEHRPASQLNSADSKTYEDIAELEINYALSIHCKMIHRLRWHFPINIHSSGELLNISPTDLITGAIYVVSQHIQLSRNP